MDQSQLPESIVIATNSGGFGVRQEFLDSTLRNTREDFRKPADTTLTQGNSPVRPELPSNAAAQVREADLGTLRQNSGADGSFDLEQHFELYAQHKSQQHQTAFGATGFSGSGSQNRGSLDSTQGEMSILLRKYAANNRISGWQQPIQGHAIRSKIIVKPTRSENDSREREDSVDGMTDKPQSSVITPDVTTPLKPPFTNESVEQFMSMRIKANPYELKQLREQSMKNHEIKMVRYVIDAEVRGQKLRRDASFPRDQQSETFKVYANGAIVDESAMQQQDKSRGTMHASAYGQYLDASGSRDVGAGKSQVNISSSAHADSQYLDTMQYSSAQLQSPEHSQNLLVFEEAIKANPSALKAETPYMSGNHDFRIRKGRYLGPRSKFNAIEGQNSRIAETIRSSVNKGMPLDGYLAAQGDHYLQMDQEPVIVDRKRSGKFHHANRSMDAKTRSYKQAPFSQRDGRSPRRYDRSKRSGKRPAKQPLFDLLKRDQVSKRTNQRSENSFLDEMIQQPYIPSAYENEASTRMSLKIQNSRHANDSKQGQYVDFHRRAATDMRDSVFESVDTNTSNIKLQELVTNSKLTTGRGPLTGLQSFSRNSPQGSLDKKTDSKGSRGGFLKMPENVHAPLKLSPRDMDDAAAETFKALSRKSSRMEGSRPGRQEIEMPRPSSKEAENKNQRSFSVMDMKNLKPEVAQKPFSVQDMARIIRKQAATEVFKPQPAPFGGKETLMTSVQNRKAAHESRRNKTVLNALCQQIESGVDRLALPDVYRSHGTSLDVRSSLSATATQPKRGMYLTAKQRKHYLMEQQKGGRVGKEFPHHKVGGPSASPVKTNRAASDYEATEKYNRFASSMPTPVSSVQTGHNKGKSPDFRADSSMADVVSRAITEESDSSFESTEDLEPSKDTHVNVQAFQRHGPQRARAFKQSAGKKYRINNKGGKFMHELDAMVQQRHDAEKGHERIRQDLEDAVNRRKGQPLRNKKYHTQA